MSDLYEADFRDGWKPFDGTVLYTVEGGNAGRVIGQYTWLDLTTPRVRIAGEIGIERGDLHSGRMVGGWFDPFRMFEVQELKGRAVILEIPGVGRSHVRLRCRPDLVNGTGRAMIKYPVKILFEATSGPIPGMTRAEIAEALRSPIHDELWGAGHDRLAAIALAAAVALVGFPVPESVVPDGYSGLFE